MAGGSYADRITGEKIALLALWTLLAGSLLMWFSASLPLSIAAALLMAVGMGVNNAAVFKMARQYVREAVGGASGLIGGLGAFGGFVLPPAMGLVAERSGSARYANGFLLLAVLAAIGLLIAAALKAGISVTAAAAAPERKIRVA